MGSKSFRTAKVLSALALAFIVHAPPVSAQSPAPSSNASAPTPAPAISPKPKAKPKAKTKPGAAASPSLSTSAAASTDAVAMPVAAAAPALPLQVAQVTPTPPPPPPPPPPPSWNESTSLTGTQLVPISTGAPAAVAVPATAAVAPPSTDLERRVEALETRLDAANSLLKDYEGELRWLRMLKISGYLQPQLLLQFYNASGSPNVTSSGTLPLRIGANDTTTMPVTALNNVESTTNGDYFRFRRARLRVEFQPVDSARFVFEIDPTPTGGPTPGSGTIARTIEAQGIAHWTSHITTEFAMGIFKIPFGYEILQNDADRPFIERSWGERNMTPGEFDTGARAYTTFFDGALTFQAAVINGNMEGEKTFTILPDLNKGKDVLGRVNYDFGSFDVGASGYYGQGELVSETLLAFKQYPRGAGNLEARLHRTFFKELGETKVYLEGTVATNMDRGVYYESGIGLPALPVQVVTQNVADLHELSVWARAEQDFTRWFTLGLRFDYYNPNDTVCGMVNTCSSLKSARATYAAVGAVHFTRWLQFMLEYDHSIDNVHAVTSPAPSKLIDMVSSVLQVRF